MSRMRVVLFSLVYLKLVISINPNYHRYSDKTLTEPSCSPINDEGVIWQKCYFEKNQWFGITDQKLTYQEAVHTCQNAGGELVSVTSQTIDQCVFTAMNTANVKEELILFSGRYFEPLEDWFWCPRLEPDNLEDACDSHFGSFTNWYVASDGNCMGGYISIGTSEVPSYSDYGWLRRSCRSVSIVPVRAMCRLDCDALKSQN